MGKCGKGKRVSWDFLFGDLSFKHGEKSNIGDFLFKQLFNLKDFSLESACFGTSVARPQKGCIHK